MTTETLTPQIVLEASNTPLVPATEEQQKLVSTLQSLAPKISQYTLFADKLTVKNQSDADAAAVMLARIAADGKTVTESIKSHKEAAKKRHGMWCDLENLFISPFSIAYKKAKGIVLVWQEAEQKKAEDEERQRQAEINAETERKRQALLKKADKLKTPEKAEALREQAETLVPPVLSIQAPKVSSGIGFRSQRRWKVVKVDKAVFVKAAMDNPQLLGYITIEETKLASTKTSNTEFKADGITFELKAV